jgi:ribosomal protein S6--L-glutamate ligase
MNILILNAAEQSHPTQSIIKAGEKRGHKMIVHDPANFSPLVSDVESGFDRMYQLMPNGTSRLSICDIDFLIPRISSYLTYNSFIVEHFTENLGIPSIQSAAGLRAASNKFHTIQICSRNGIKTPITVYAKTANDIDFLIEKVKGIPFIIKYNSGSQGAGVMLVESRKTAISTIEGLLKNKADIILQQFIEARGQDIRAVVVGDQVVVAYRRTAPKGDFRSNISLGGTGELVKLSMDDQIICVKASKAIGLEVSGVDLIKDTNGVTYLNEINSNFGFAGEKITGASFGEHIINYIEKRKSSGTDSATPKAPDYYEQLRAQYKSVSQQLKYFTENERMQQIFDATKGQDIHYKGFNGKPNLRKIRSLNSLYQIVFDTFLIKQ